MPEPPAAVCGNAEIEAGELCDGPTLGGSTCAQLGQGSGTLACSSTCTGFDTSECHATPPPQCGNGVLDPGEQCDPPRTGTCTSDCRDISDHCVAGVTILLSALDENGVHAFQIPATCGDAIDLTAPPLHTVRARFVGPTGQPLPPFAVITGVRFDRQGAPPTRGESPYGVGTVLPDGSMTARLTDGTYTAHVNTRCATGYGAIDLAPVVVAGADRDLGTVPLETVDLVTVSGSITNTGPTPNAVAVHVVGPGTGGAFCTQTEPAVSVGGAHRYTVQVPRGRIEITGDATEIGQICASGSTAMQHRRFTRVESVSGDATIDLPLEAPVHLSGTLHEANGNPLASTGVRASRLDDARQVSSLCPTDAQGRFTIPVPRSGRYALFAEPAPAINPPHASQRLDLLADVGASSTDVGTVTLAAGCRLAGALRRPHTSGPALASFLRFAVVPESNECHTLIIGHEIGSGSALAFELQTRGD